MNKCEYCGNYHDGSYGSGRFCSPKCARKFSNTFVSEEGRQNQIKALNDGENREKGLINRKNNNKTNPNYHKEYRNDLRPSFKHPLTLGKIGELEVGKKFIQYGYDVFVPLVDTGGVDLVVYDGNDFKTVQVKSSTSEKINNDGICECSSFITHYKKRNIHDGTYTQIKQKYDPDKVNYLALYSAYQDDSYLMENKPDFPYGITIRHTPPANNQSDKINYAEDYQIDKVLSLLNPIPGVYYEDDENIIDSDFIELD